jgi:signal transduction histidine kinase
MTRTGRLAWPTAAAVAAVVALGFLCGVHLENLHNGLLGVSFAFVGALVVRHSPDPDSPGHREGRLFLLSGVVSGLMFTCRQVGYAPAVPGAAWFAWLGIWPLPLVLVLVGLTIMSFPSGRLPGPVWRRLTVVAAALAVVLSVASALWPVEYGRTGVLVAHPLAVPGAELVQGLFTVTSNLVYFAFQLMWAVCLVVRMLGADAAESRQLWWFVGAAATSVVAMVLSFAIGDSPIGGLLFVSLLPVAAGISMLESSYERLLRDLRASARRIVTAGDDARHRLERDLHDGAQQRLVTLGMDLGALVELAAASGNQALSEAADRARVELLEATAELRELAQGIHPTILTEQGLVAAVERLADRSPVPVTVTARLPGRLPTHVEEAAYYVVAEALTNAVKHSRAGAVVVELTRTGDGVCVRVRDDGRGGADVTGHGLVGLADRMLMLGGHLTVDSGPGGTTVGAVLPCA